MQVWTLTVDDTDAIYVSIHPSEQSAVDTLFENYDAEGEFPRDDIQTLLDANGLVVHIDAHEIDWIRL